GTGRPGSRKTAPRSPAKFIRLRDVLRVRRATCVRWDLDAGRVAQRRGAPCGGEPPAGPLDERTEPLDARRFELRGARTSDPLTRSPRSRPAAGSTPTMNAVALPALAHCARRSARTSSVVSDAGAAGAAAGPSGTRSATRSATGSTAAEADGWKRPLSRARAK